MFSGRRTFRQTSVHGVVGPGASVPGVVGPGADVVAAAEPFSPSSCSSSATRHTGRL